MGEELNTIWKEVCSKVKEQVSPDTFKRWFSSTQLIEANEESLSVHIPNHIYGLWIESNYMAILNHAVVEILGQPRKIEWQSDSVASYDENNDSNKIQVEKVLKASLLSSKR